MSKNNIVLVSEYNMPEMFKCVWEKEAQVIRAKKELKNYLSFNRKYIDK